MTTKHYTNAYQDGWMQTFTGNQFWPTKPRLMDIDLYDIAGPLARQCRYGGHCVKFYSVAEHCVHVARFAPDHLKLQALMHDASEAYLVDIPSPLKKHIPRYYEYEDALMQLIATKFGFNYPLDPAVKMIDMALLDDERRQNMTRIDCSNELWGNTVPGTGAALQFWPPGEAQRQFLITYDQVKSLKQVAA